MLTSFLFLFISKKSLIVVILFYRATSRLKDKLSSSQFIEEEICCAGVAITLDDFDKAISQFQTQHSFAFGAPKVNKQTNERNEACSFLI
jgi:hypothetical protein